MVLKIDTENDDYRFYKTLNEDVQLKPDQYNQWDIQFQNGDYVNVNGEDSLKNAICIAIMTRLGELNTNPLYNQFGCRLHELIKANKNSMVTYKVELYTLEVLEQMRRIKNVNWIEITEPDNHNYQISFSVTSITDKTITGSVNV